MCSPQQSSGNCNLFLEGGVCASWLFETLHWRSRLFSTLHWRPRLFETLLWRPTFFGDRLLTFTSMNLYILYQEIVLCVLILFLSFLQTWLFCFIGILYAFAHRLFLWSMFSDITRRFRISLFFFYFKH